MGVAARAGRRAPTRSVGMQPLRVAAGRRRQFASVLHSFSEAVGMSRGAGTRRAAPGCDRRIGAGRRGQAASDLMAFRRRRARAGHRASLAATGMEFVSDANFALTLHEFTQRHAGGDRRVTTEN